MDALIAGNSHLLEKIFKFCGAESLLKCRLVCKLWAEEATRILRMRGTIIAFRSLEDIEEFITVTRPTSKTFTHFLIDTPSNYLTILEDEKYQISSPIINLLDSYNEDIQELKFWYSPIIRQVSNAEASENNTYFTEDEDAVKGVDEIIELKHLRNLQLLSNYVHAAATQQTPASLHLMPKYLSYLSTPNLRFLGVQHLYDTDCSSTVISIIKSSHCELEYLKIPAKPFSEIIKDSSVFLNHLTELDLLGIFHGFSCATDETLDCIIKSCPNLKKLGIAFSFRIRSTKIQTLWNTLANTLEELKCTIQDRNLLARQIVRTDFIFPEMGKLRNLQMRWSNPGLIYYIDRLPVMKELVLDTVWTRKISGNVFPNGQAFHDGASKYSQLVSLKLTESVNSEHIKSFSCYFPNLKVLGCAFDSNAALRSVYEYMQSLKWLIIERRSNITESGGMCGSEENELELATEKFLKGETGPFCESRLPSISNLKALETLELCQLGVTWQSLMFGVVNLPNLKRLAIQSKAFKDLPFPMAEGEDRKGQYSSLGFIASRLKQLRSLTLWVRHNSERPSSSDIRQMQEDIPSLNEIKILNHSLCGI